MSWNEILQYALIAYIALNVILSIAGIFLCIRSNYSWWIISIDALSAIFGVVGLLLFQAHLTDSSVRLVWRIVFPAYAAATVFGIAVDVYDEWKKEQVLAVFIGGTLALVTELPALIVNYFFAYGW